MRQHDNTTYEEGIRVLLTSTPACRYRGSISEPVRQTAIMPTGTDLLGYRVHGSRPAWPSDRRRGATCTRNAHPDNVRAIQVAPQVVGHALEPHDQPGTRKP